MSQSLLETRNKFTMSNPKAGMAFTQDSFFKWSDNNFYRTSSNDMSAEVRLKTVFNPLLLIDSCT